MAYGVVREKGYPVGQLPGLPVKKKIICPVNCVTSNPFLKIQQITLLLITNYLSLYFYTLNAIYVLNFELWFFH